MRILVTGANGYLGQGVVRQLLNDGLDVIATDFKDDYIDKRAQLIKADLFSLEEPYLSLGSPDVVLHMAWRNGFVHNDNTHIEDFQNHFHFLQEMFASDVKRVAVMGSMHEIGFFEGSIKAETPTNPQSLYGISKNALRQAVIHESHVYGKSFQWIRGFYIVGNSEYGSSVFSKITEAEKRGEKEFPFTSGQNQWDFIDYDVFCQQVAAIVQQDEECGVINACSGKPEKLADRVEQFIRENGYKIQLAYNTFPDRPYDSKAVWGDDSVIRKIMMKYEKK